jgi:hypothetical protein
LGVDKNVRSWLAETHGSQFELVRHCLSELLVNDLISSDQVRRLVIRVLAALGCIGPLIVRLYIPKYSYLHGLDTPDLYIAAVRADRLLFISLSMIAAGLVTVFQWQGLFPSLRDYLALKPLPLRLYQVFVARFLSSLVVLVIVLTDLNLASSILFPLLTSGRWQSPSFGIQYIATHASASFCAGLFTFFAIGTMQGALMISLPLRMFERVSVLVQTLLATAFVAALPHVLDIPNWYKSMAARPRWMGLFPPVWFLGLYETLLGGTDRYFLDLRATAIMGMGGVLFLGLGTYLLSYRRHTSRMLEAALPRSNGLSLIDRMASAGLGMFVKHSPERAVVVFAIQTLRRSRQHRLVIGFWIAIAILVGLQTVGPGAVARLHAGRSWGVLEVDSILAVPLVMSAVLISAVCYVFQLPSEVQAGWVFRMAERTSRRELLASVECILILLGVVPVLILTTPILALGLGWAVSLAYMTLGAVWMLLLVEARLRDWHKIPFTCSYVPGRRNFWQTMGTYGLLFGVLIPAIAYCESRILRPLVLLASAAVLSPFYFALRSARQTHWEIVPLLFDESDEPLLGTLGLNRE